MHDACLWTALAFYALGILLIVPSVYAVGRRSHPLSLGALGLGLGGTRRRAGG